MALMVDVDADSGMESVDKEIEVLYNLTSSKLITIINDFLNKNHNKRYIKSLIYMITEL